MTSTTRLYSTRKQRIAGTDHPIFATITRDGHRWIATEICNGTALDTIRTSTKREAIAHAKEVWACADEGCTEDTMTGCAFKIATSNGAFFQIHLVGAQTEDEARALAEEAANAPGTLAEEARMASQIGAEPAGRYRAFRVTETDDDLDDGEVRFLDSGAEG